MSYGLNRATAGLGGEEIADVAGDASTAGKCLIPTVEHVVAGDWDIVVRMTIDYHLQ